MSRQLPHMRLLWGLLLLAGMGLGWVLILAVPDTLRGPPVQVPEGTDVDSVTIVTSESGAVQLPMMRQASGPASDAPAGKSEWWEDEEYMTALREKWAEVHSWNVDARVKEFAERMAGTINLVQTLEMSGNLLEEIPLDISDFDFVPEHEKEAIAITVQFAAGRRIQYGKDPSQSLGEEDLRALYSNVQQDPLLYPTSYLPDALGAKFFDLPFEKRAEIAKLRIDFLKRVAPLVADRTDRQTTMLHLLKREGRLYQGKPLDQLSSLDPTYPFLEQQILQIGAEYRGAVNSVIAN